MPLSSRFTQRLSFFLNRHQSVCAAILFMVLSASAVMAAPGTVSLLVDANSGAGDSFPSNIVAFDGQLFFEAEDDSFDGEPYRYDPVTGATTLIANVDRPATGDSNNPLSPPSDPVQRRLQSPPAKSNFLAVFGVRFIFYRTTRCIKGAPISIVYHSLQQTTQHAIE